MLNILLVEDDRTIGQETKLLMEMQEADRFCVTWIDRGDTAIERLSKAHGFHCLLVDLSLCDMSGIKVIEHLRQWDKETPVIVITGRQRDEVEEQCFAAGADEILVKVFELTDLIAMIKRLCAQKKSS